MAGSGVITRKEIITDDALNFGDDYGKNLQKAIDKNKEFVDSVKELSTILNSLRNTNTNSQFAVNAQNATRVTQQANEVWREQIQLENQLISIKKKQELATESTNKALIKERVALQETNKELKQQAREKLGLVTAYEKLNRKRTEAQRTLANLLAAEKQQPALIAKARREFELLDARIKQVDATTKNYTKNIGNYQSAFNGLGGSIRNVFSAFGLATGVVFAVQTLRDAFAIIQDVDKQLIAIRKTTNMSNEEMALFRKEVVDLGGALDGVTIQGLLKTSEIAGQLGIQGRANILRFSETIEKLKLTSDLVSDESVSAFAQFIQISNDSIENADRLGSVITELGNNFNATESKVLSNAAEIQKGVSVYSTAAQNVLALGAATASLGSEAEVSRTAMQKSFAIFNEAISTGKNLERVLKLTGMTEAELSEQFNKDATVVFQKFIKGLNDVRKSGGNLKNTLDDLGITEVRSFSVVGNLAANYEVLEDAMNRANSEYVENTALTNEATQSAESISAVIADLRDKWEEYILNLSESTDGTNKIRKALMYLRDNLSTIISRIVKITAVILTYVGVMKTMNSAITIFNAFKTASTLAQIAFARATGIGTTNILAQVVALKAQETAQKGVNVAMRATPWGIILAAVSAVAVAFQAFSDEVGNAKKAMEDFEDAERDKNKESANVSKENLSRILSNISKEYEVKKAQQGESIKLTEEENESKIKAVQGFIDGTNMQIEANKKLTSELEAEHEKRRTAYYSFITDMEAKIKQRNTAGRQMALDNAKKEYNDLSLNNKKSITALKLKNESLIEEAKTYQNELGEIQRQVNINSANNQRELTEKEKREIERRRKEYLAGLKKQADEEFALLQFRLKNAVDLNKQIIEADSSDLTQRLDAFSENAQLESSILRDVAEKKLKDISWYNDEIRTLKQEEINILLNGGQIQRQLNNQEILALEEYHATVLASKNKLNADSQKLVDDEVKRNEDRTKRILLNQDTELNNAIASATKIYQINLKSAKSEAERVGITEGYESEIFTLKSDYAKKSLNEQISAIKKLMAENELSKETEEKLLNDLSKYKAEKANLDLEIQRQYSDKRVELEEQTIDRIKELSRDLAYSLADLTNTIFDRRISKIEEEQERWNEYYDAQIELAGENERQKEYLEAEREQKEKELEARKRKEMIKQEMFNRTMAIAEIGINLAKTLTAINLAAAQMDALAAFGFGSVGAAYRGLQIGLAVGTAAAQTAAVLAAPMPKYEKGTENHPGGFALVGEKRPEVIKEPGKDPYVVMKPSVLNLAKGTEVVPSLEEYHKMQRAAIMASLDSQLYKMNVYQTNKSFTDRYTQEMIEELKQVNRNIKGNKTNVVVYPQKVDIPHSVWRSNNVNWS